MQNFSNSPWRDKAEEEEEGVRQLVMGVMVISLQLREEGINAER